MIILRQKEYARKDYKGLNRVQRKELRKERDRLARNLNEGRKYNNKWYRENLDRVKKSYEEDLAALKEKRLGKDELEKEEENLKKRFNFRNEVHRRGRNDLHDIDIKHRKDEAKGIREEIKNQSFKTKFKNYRKALWNGEVGLGKEENRAAMLGVPAVGIVSGGIALHEHNKKKKKEEKKKEERYNIKIDKKRLSDYDSGKGIVEGALIAGGDDATRGFLKGSAKGATIGASGGALYRTMKDRKKYREKYSFEDLRRSRGHSQFKNDKTTSYYFIRSTPHSVHNDYEKDSKDYNKLVRKRNRIHKNLKSSEAGWGAYLGGTVGGPLGMAAASVASGTIPAYFAVKSGEMAADKADSEGKTDKEIIKSAAWSGLKTGALAGAAKGIVKGAVRGTPRFSLRPKTQSTRTAVKALGSGYSSALMGAFGGMAGAITNTKDRLKKRESDYKKEKKKSIREKEKEEKKEKGNKNDNTKTKDI